MFGAFLQSLYPKSEIKRVAKSSPKINEREKYTECESSLRSFIEHAWPIVEPGRRFIPNWHIDSICRHLEAVTHGEILRLVINIPPRSSKSTIVSVMWPAWVWIQDPSKQFIAVSNGGDLAVRDSLATRRLIESDWYQRGWSDKFCFTSDQNQKTRYENNKRGRRVSYGMGSRITGDGGDFILIDDPHDAETAMFSDTERKNVLNKFDHEIGNRVNDPATTATVVIMQRLHADDLAGHLLKTGDYEHLCFPMEYEPARKCVTCLGVQDPRTKEKELLCAERFPSGWVEKEKKRLGTYGASGQLQQSPVPAGGGIIQLNWFKKYGILPDRRYWIETCQFWDTAQKANELLNCPWVCGTWIRTHEGYYLADVFREWMEYPQGKRMVKSLGEKWEPNVVVIEDKSTGQSLLQEGDYFGTLPMVPFEPESDKVTRLSVESPTIEAGNVYLPESAPWLPDFLSEIGTFPLSATMDQADMLSMALKYFRTRIVSFDYESTGRKRTTSQMSNY